MKHFKVFVRKPGSIVWEYADTYEGASTAMMAQRLARVENPGYAVKVVNAALKSSSVEDYVKLDMMAEKVLL